jgi:ABC-type branched-subunit amino acid transport system permease subunit
MTMSTAEGEQKRPWLYAFLILGLVSAWMLTMRLLNMQFLTPEFEISLIYLPTALAGIIVAYLTLRSRGNP